MSDTAISGFTNDASPAGADLLVTAKSPFGAGSNRKVTITNLFEAGTDYRKLVFVSGLAVTAAEYSVGRDADGTNQLHFNVPTGASFEWSVNDSSKMTLNATSLTTGLPIYAPDGTVGAPAYTLSTDVDTGLYSIGANNLGVTLGGVKYLDLASTASSITQAVATTGSPVLLTVTGAAHTTLTASTEATDLNFNLARTVQFATGAITTQRAVRFQAPTYGFVGASTITTAATVSISGAPAVGTNATITTPLALWVESGSARFDGRILMKDGAANNLSLAFNSQLDLGFFYGDSTHLGMVVGGTVAAYLTTGGFQGYGNLDLAGGNTSTGIRIYDNYFSGLWLSFQPTGLTIAPQIRTSGSPVGLTYTAPAHTTLTTGTEASDWNFNLARTVQFATTTPTTQRAIQISAPTYSCDTAAQTITTAATMYISGAPTAGTNTTITNAYALWVQAGAVKFEGNFNATGGMLASNSSYVTHGRAYNTTAGTAASPAYNFWDYECGMYLSGNTLGFSTGGTAKLTITSLGNFALTQSVSTTGSPVALTLTGGAHTTLTASTEASDWNINLARIVQFAAGALTTQRAVLIQAPTYAFVTASTLTNAATFAISGAPITGTNATITNAYSLWVQAGTTCLAGNLISGGAQTRNVTAVAAATYDLVTTDDILDVTYTGTGAVTSLTLPTAQMIKGRTIVIKDGGGLAGTNNITIDTEGGEQIDGADTFVMNANWESVTLTVNTAGTGWRVI